MYREEPRVSQTCILRTVSTIRLREGRTDPSMPSYLANGPRVEGAAVAVPDVAGVCVRGFPPESSFNQLLKLQLIRSRLHGTLYSFSRSDLFCLDVLDRGGPLQKRLRSSRSCVMSEIQSRFRKYVVTYPFMSSNGTAMI